MVSQTAVRVPLLAGDLNFKKNLNIKKDKHVKK